MIPYPLELFQSTLSLRRATPGGWAGWVHGLISIHALLAESDAFSPLGALFLDISIHALLAESDGEPAGGGGHHGISIHALLAESDFGGVRTYLDNIISIHALLAESDVIRNFPPRAARGFQSTLSLRRATTAPPHRRGSSPHFNPRSPCGERQRFRCPGIHGIDFNPRSPCGERPLRVGRRGWDGTFQSTLSLRRATASTMGCYQAAIFQSTLSLRRATASSR